MNLTELIRTGLDSDIHYTMLNATGNVNEDARSASTVDAFNATAGVWVCYEFSQPSYVSFYSEFACKIYNVPPTGDSSAFGTSALAGTWVTANKGIGFQPEVLASLTSGTFPDEVTWAVSGGQVVQRFIVKSVDTNPGVLMLRCNKDAQCKLIFKA